TVSVEAVKALFLGEDVEETMSLMKLVADHKQICEPTLAPGSMKNYGTAETYLQKFLNHNFKKKDLPLEELNYRFILDFENFLKPYKPIDHHKPLNNNGVI